MKANLVVAILFALSLCFSVVAQPQQQPVAKDNAYIIISRPTAEALYSGKIKGEQWAELVEAVNDYVKAAYSLVTLTKGYISIELPLTTAKRWRDELSNPSGSDDNQWVKEIELALKKGLEAPVPAAPSVTITLPASPCHSQVLRGEECTGEARRLHPKDGADVEKAKRP